MGYKQFHPTDFNQKQILVFPQGTSENKKLCTKGKEGAFFEVSRRQASSVNELGTSSGLEKDWVQGKSDAYAPDVILSRDPDEPQMTVTLQGPDPVSYKSDTEEKSSPNAMEGILDDVISRLHYKFFGVKKLGARGKYQYIIDEFLMDEGNLLLGKFPDVSINVSKVLSSNMQQMISRMKSRNDPKIQNIETRRLEMIYTTVRSGLIKSFFGLLKYLNDQHDQESLTQNVVMDACDFLKDYFSIWGKLVYTGQRSDYNKSNKELDWSSSSSIFKYIESLIDVTKFRSSLVWIVWDSFLKWSLSHRGKESIVTYTNIYLEKLVEIHSQRLLKYRTLQPHIANASTGINLGGRKRSKPHQYLGKQNDMVLENLRCKTSLESGKDFIERNKRISLSINDYFSSMQKDLGVKYDSIFNEQDGQYLEHIGSKISTKFPSNVNRASLLYNAIFVSKDIITPGFLGTIISFHENQGGSLSLETLLDYGWEFIQDFFSRWKKYVTKVEFGENLFVKFCEKPRHTPDWTNPIESFYYCLIYTQHQYSPPKILNYLSHQWLDQLEKNNSYISQDVTSNIGMQD